MLEYMRSQGGDFAEAAAAFEVATGLEDSEGNEGFRGLLEKKWTSVVRLQRKVPRGGLLLARSLACLLVPVCVIVPAL